MKAFIWVLVLIVIIGGGIYVYKSKTSETQTTNTSIADTISITSIKPNPATRDQTITIKGKGFSTTHLNTVVFSSSALAVGLPSPDGITITFKPSDYSTLRTGMIYVIDPTLISAGLLTKSDLFLSGTAAKQMVGKSNSIEFTITN